MWKNRLCYLALLACTGLFFICYDGYLSLYVFSLSLLLPFVSLAVSLPGMLGARAVLSAGGAGASGVPCARKGENIPLRLRVWNVTPFSSGRIRVRLSVENTLTGQREQERFSISASPLPQVLEHQLSSRACGQLLCRMERAWVSDYLGLFSLPLLHNPRQEAAAFFWPAVHPLVLELQESSVPDSEGERYSQTKPGDDPTELFALRDWREGDRLSRIHWKLSQKLGRPLVKELGLPLSDHRLFLLDLNGTGTEADALLDAFASLSSFLAEGEVAHRAAYWEPSAQVLHCREVVGPEDLLPLWKELLASGGHASLPTPRQEDLPSGISHVIYLCCRPQETVLEAVKLKWPSARLSILYTDPEAERGPALAGKEARRVQPGQAAQELNGMAL